MTSMLPAPVDSVLFPPANLNVLVNNLLPVPSCVILNTKLLPATAFGISLSVTLPSAVSVKILPLAALQLAFAAMLPFSVPMFTTVSLNCFNLVCEPSMVFNEVILPLVCIPVLLMFANSVTKSLFALTSVPIFPPCPNLISLFSTAPILVSSLCFKKAIWSFAVLLCA